MPGVPSHVAQTKTHRTRAAPVKRRHTLAGGQAPRERRTTYQEHLHRKQVNEDHSCSSGWNDGSAQKQRTGTPQLQSWPQTYQDSPHPVPGGYTHPLRSEPKVSGRQHPININGAGLLARVPSTRVFSMVNTAISLRLWLLITNESNQGHGTGL